MAGASRAIAAAADAFGLDELLRGDEPFAHGREAVRQALVNLEAVAAPAGSMTVVLGSGWPGILLHEAIGHGLEGDFNRKGTSAFSNRIGQQGGRRTRSPWSTTARSIGGAAR